MGKTTSHATNKKVKKKITSSSIITLQNYHALID